MFGVVFGLAAGLMPGPLLALVIQQTLRHGPGEGIKVAAAPLLTDLPIVAAALFALDRLVDADGVLGAISLPYPPTPLHSVLGHVVGWIQRAAPHAVFFILDIIYIQKIWDRAKQLGSRNQKFWIEKRNFGKRREI